MTAPTPSPRPTPHAAAPDWLAGFVAALDRQRELLAQLDELSRAMGPLIDADDAAPLLGVLDRRDRLVSLIRDDAEAASPLAEAWTTRRGALSEADRRLVQHRLDDLTWIRDRIADRDTADEARLVARRDATARELIALRGASSAATAYAADKSGSAASPRFQDREG